MLPESTFARAIEVRRLARNLMDRHGLRDWMFGFNRRKRAMGLCRYAIKAIELSWDFVQRNSEEEILDTILHEIAHALVGPEHGHDEVWKAKCIEIGARPERCGEADMPEGRWKADCPSCRTPFHRHRKPQRLGGWYCRSCGPHRGKLAWRKT